MPLTDDYLARLPWLDAQAALATEVPTGTRLTATCGWHGTRQNPVVGTYALVHPEGLLADLVGKRLKVTRSSVFRAAHSTYVLVLDQDAGLFEDLSLTRRSFLALAPLWTEELTVIVEELG